MTPISYSHALEQFPHLVGQVLAKLVKAKPQLHAADVSWYRVACHDDPDLPLDETACADILLTGNLPGRQGLCGKNGADFACYCDADCVPVEGRTQSRR